MQCTSPLAQTLTRLRVDRALQVGHALERGEEAHEREGDGHHVFDDAPAVGAGEVAGAGRLRPSGAGAALLQVGAHAARGGAAAELLLRRIAVLLADVARVVVLEVVALPHGGGYRLACWLDL